MKVRVTISVEELFARAVDRTMFDARAANSLLGGSEAGTEVFTPMTYAELDIFTDELIAISRRIALKLFDRISDFDHDHDGRNLVFGVELKKPEPANGFASLLARVLLLWMLSWWWGRWAGCNLWMQYSNEYESALGSLCSGLAGIVVTQGTYY
jgi:hypothetical protein